MKNWLITADVHIDDYPQFNYSNRARLNQFLALADRYVELAKENNCDTIVLAGDTINRPTNRPYVVNVVYQFLEKLSKNFDKVYYILGQHDTDSKSNIVTANDTVLTALEFSNFEYMDHKILTMPSGKKIAFKDWTPKQDVSWIEDKVDVLIAHYTKMDGFGQTIDESKFDLMIHGDIHNDQEIDKFISIGNPIQKDMNSQMNGTIIIMNPDTCEWNRVQVDPDHTRFLRIHYTRNKEEEGFQGPIEYFIYKPRIRTDVDKKTVNDAPDWNDVEELVTEVVQNNKLSSIHAEVKGRNPKFTEMDFNFTLKKLIIHGYRSIEDLEIDFTGNDRIILVGDNGSGKSSIVKALKSIFEKSRNLSDEQSDFTKTVRVELEFYYQNKLYHVCRGSSQNWIEIDGNRLKYNNKTEFENDIVKQLPFMKYIDLFFNTSNVQNLEEKFSPSRRISLISKFYRLDRINAYRVTADEIRSEKESKLSSRKSDLDKKSGSLNIIQKRLTELSMYEGHERSEYSDKVDYLNGLLDKESDRKNWESKLKILESSKNHHQSQLDQYKDRLNINTKECEDFIESSKSKLTKIDAEIDRLSSRKQELESLLKSKKEYYDKGIKLKSDISSLESGICPTCGTKVSNDSTKAKLSELQKEIIECREKYGSIVNSLKSYSSKELEPNFHSKAIIGLRSSYSDINNEIRIYSTKLDLYKVAKSDYDAEEKELQKCKDDIDQHKLLEPDKVEIPIDLREQIFSATSELTKFDEYHKNLEDKEDTELEIRAIKDTMSLIQEEVDNYYKYSNLVCNTGEVMYNILCKMAEVFSDSSIKYEVKKGVYRGKAFIEFNSYFKVKDKWRIYESLSDGQKTVSDLDFLTKLFSVRVGLLVLDESLKHLDYKYSPLAWEIITRMNANTIIVSTHDANFSNYTKKIDLALNQEGKTIANII